MCGKLVPSLLNREIKEKPASKSPGIYNKCSEHNFVRFEWPLEVHFHSEDSENTVKSVGGLVVVVGKGHLNGY